MNYIDETHLYKKKNNKTIDWMKSIGCSIPFEYNGEQGKLELIDYYIENKVYMVKVRFDGENYDLRLSSLKNCSLSKLFENKRKLHKELLELESAKERSAQEQLKKDYYKKQVISKISELNCDIEVIGDYAGYRKPIKCRCTKCMHTWDARPASIFKGSGVSCLACAGKVVNNHDKRNSIYYTHPDLAAVFVNIQDAFENIFNRGQREKNKFLCRCRDCGSIQQKTKGALWHGFNCDFCGDGVSYPNKICFKLIDILSKKYDIKEIEREFAPYWSDGRRYDIKFNFNCKNYIIEMDGAFHYIDNNLSGMTAEEAIEIDNIKTEKASQNGYSLIRIDCDYRNTLERFDYIKSNIQKSELAEMFDLNEVDWGAVDSYALGSMFMDVCNEVRYQKDISIELLMEKFNISEATIRNYIKRGKEIGVIDEKVRVKMKKQSKIYDWYVFKQGVLVNDTPFRNMYEIEKNSLRTTGVKLDNSSLSCLMKDFGVGEMSRKYKGFRFIKIPVGERLKEYI